MEGPHTSPTIPSLAMLAIQEEGSNNLEPKITIISPVMSARDFTVTGASPIEHSFSLHWSVVKAVAAIKVLFFALSFSIPSKITCQSNEDLFFFY